MWKSKNFLHNQVTCKSWKTSTNLLSREILNDMERYFKNFGHNCDLNAEDITLKNKGNVRRTVVEWTTIDPISNLALQHFNSYSAITNERKFHLECHPKTIHPFSKFKFIWEVLMSFIYVSGLIYVPLQYLDYVDKDDNTNIGNLHIMKLVKSICVIDMALQFFIGYYDERTFTVSKPNNILSTAPSVASLLS